MTPPRFPVGDGQVSKSQLKRLAAQRPPRFPVTVPLPRYGTHDGYTTLYSEDVAALEAEVVALRKVLEAAQTAMATDSRVLPCLCRPEDECLYCDRLRAAIREYEAARDGGAA